LKKDLKGREILLSYKKCLEMGIPKSIVTPLISLEGDKLNAVLRKNKMLINIFRKCISEIPSRLFLQPKIVYEYDRYLVCAIAVS